jgi:hypothetical protein
MSVAEVVARMDAIVATCPVKQRYVAGRLRRFVRRLDRLDGELARGFGLN